MRFEYTEKQERQLRITEIEAILENDLYEDAEQEKELIQELEELKMTNKKRVLQISLDILVGPKCDGMELADDVADELERRGFRVVGAGFQEDMTELYEEQYPELIK